MVLSKLKINNTGFTLLEMMVTVTIIAIMSVIYLINYRTTNKRIVLDQAVAGVVADLRYAQNMAMNVKMFGAEVPLGGYGLNVSSSTTSYVIFADLDGDKAYDSPGEKNIERSFPKNVIFDAVLTTIDDIDFQPPHPTVWIDGAVWATGDPSAPVTPADIVIRYGAAGPGRKITINRLTGQISVSNL